MSQPDSGNPRAEIRATEIRSYQRKITLTLTNQEACDGVPLGDLFDSVELNINDVSPDLSAQSGEVFERGSGVLLGTFLASTNLTNGDHE